MLEYIWKSWSELKDQAKGKQIFLFGRSEDWVPKTIPHLSEFKNIVVVDNNPAYENTFFHGLKVVGPKILESHDKKIFI